MKKISNLPKNELIERNTYFEISIKANKSIHSFFKYPAKFIPEIPNWAIRNFSNKNDIVMDCFAGSGTTLVEASVLERNPYAIDSDPLSRLLCKVKTRHLSTNDLKNIHQLKEKILKHPATPKIPKFKNLNYWFTQENIIKLGRLRNNIDILCKNKSKYKDFFYAVLASIIRQSSNADIQSPKPYISKKYPRKPLDPFYLFSKKTDSLITIFNGKKILKKVAKIKGEDATLINPTLSSKVDLIVASPPYSNAFDYVRVLKLENLWLGLLDEDDLCKQNKIQVGNEMIKHNEYNGGAPSSDIHQLNVFLKKLYSLDKKRAYVIKNYFEQMDKNLKAACYYLKNGSYYICVVGNSIIKNQKLNVSEILIELAQKNSFTTENFFSYVIKNPYLRIPRKGQGGLIKYDNILVMKKYER